MTGKLWCSLKRDLKERDRRGHINILASFLREAAKKILFSGQISKSFFFVVVLLITKPRGGGLDALVDCPLKKGLFCGFPYLLYMLLLWLEGLQLLLRDRVLDVQQVLVLRQRVELQSNLYIS